MAVKQFETKRFGKNLTSSFIHVSDVNLDDRVDIVTGRFWYENPGLAAGAWVRHEIGGTLQDTIAMFDVDEDGVTIRPLAGFSIGVTDQVSERIAYH